MTEVCVSGLCMLASQELLNHEAVAAKLGREQKS